MSSCTRPPGVLGGVLGALEGVQSALGGVQHALGGVEVVVVGGAVEDDPPAGHVSRAESRVTDLQEPPAGKHVYWY